MRLSHLVWALPLLAQAACSYNRYAVSGEVASARNDGKWRIVHEPPAPPPPPAAVAPPVDSASDAPAVAASSDAAPPSDAAFPMEDAAAVAAPAPTGEPAAEPVAPEAPSRAPVAHERIDLSQEPLDSSAGEPPKPKLRRMVWSLSMRMGGSFGSEDLLVVTYTNGTTETLTTGGGVNFYLGTTVVPFKLGSHSLGFGFEGGWKYSSIGQGSDTDISLSRHVFLPRVQYGYELSRGIHWIAAVGAQYETGIELKASGAFVGKSKFDNALGGFGETGVLLDIGLFGLDLTVRHTRLDYSLPMGPSISANSFGIFCAVHIGLVKADNTFASDTSN